MSEWVYNPPDGARAFIHAGTNPDVAGDLEREIMNCRHVARVGPQWAVVRTQNKQNPSHSHPPRWHRVKLRLSDSDFGNDLVDAMAFCDQTSGRLRFHGPFPRPMGDGYPVCQWCKKMGGGP